MSMYWLCLAATAFDSSGRNDIFAQVAASVLQHDDGGFVGKASVKKQQGRECIVERALKLKLRSAPDVVELLSCDIGETCVEDASSSSGGRCAVVSADGAAAMEPRLEEECTKCQGKEACRGVKDQSKIGCGSCNADDACYYLGRDVTIGKNSCNNYNSCVRSKGDIGNNSCTEFISCYESQVSIGSNSCNAYMSCHTVTGDNVPDDKCNTKDECHGQYTAPTEVPSEMPSWAPSSTKPSEMPSWAPSSTKPTEIPSSSPMPSISSTFAADVFEFVAHGYCLDARGSSYNFFQLNSAPDSTDYDAYCFNWCLQNDQTNFVGVQTWTSKGQAKCSCLFAKPGGLDGLDKESYNPPADYANDRYPGEGEIQDRTHNTHIYEVDYDFKCFRKRNPDSQGTTEETEAQLATKKIRG